MAEREEGEPIIREEQASHKRSTQVAVIGLAIVLFIGAAASVFNGMRKDKAEANKKQEDRLEAQARDSKTGTTLEAISKRGSVSDSSDNSLDSFESDVQRRLRAEQAARNGEVISEGDTPQDLARRLREDARERERQRKEAEDARKRFAGVVNTATGGINRPSSIAGSSDKNAEAQRVQNSRRSKFSVNLGSADFPSSVAGTTSGSGVTTSVAANSSSQGSPAADDATSGSETIGQPASVGPAKDGQLLLPMATVIRAVLDSRVVSDYPGPFRGMIMDDVYDVSNQYILIPKGSRVSGRSIRVSNVNLPINARMGLGVRTVILPNGKKISFDRSSTLDREGIRGIKDTVNRHLFAQVMGIAAFALISTESSRDGSGNFQDETFEGEFGESLRQEFAPLAARYINLVPTITLNPGTTMRIYLEDEMYIEPWDTVGESLYPRT